MKHKGVSGATRLAAICLCENENSTAKGAITRQVRSNYGAERAKENSDMHVSKLEFFQDALPEHFRDEGPIQDFAKRG